MSKSAHGHQDENFWFERVLRFLKKDGLTGIYSTSFLRFFSVTALLACLVLYEYLAMLLLLKSQFGCVSHWWFLDCYIITEVNFDMRQGMSFKALFNQSLAQQ